MMTWQRCKAEIHGGDRFQMLLQSRKVELFLVLRRISYMSRQYTYTYILVVRGMRQPEFVCVLHSSIYQWLFLDFLSHLSTEYVLRSVYYVRCHLINIQRSHTRIIVELLSRMKPARITIHIWYLGPTQVKCRLSISSIFDAMNVQHFLEMLEIHCIKNVRN